MAIKSDASYNSLETFYTKLNKNILIWFDAFSFDKKLKVEKKTEIWITRIIKVLFGVQSLWISCEFIIRSLWISFHIFLSEQWSYIKIRMGIISLNGHSMSLNLKFLLIKYQWAAWSSSSSPSLTESSTNTHVDNKELSHDWHFSIAWWTSVEILSRINFCIPWIYYTNNNCILFFVCKI